MCVTVLRWMDHFFNFSNVNPYILYHFAFSISTSTRHHQMIKKLGINQLFMDCSIRLHLNKTCNCHDSTWAELVIAIATAWRHYLIRACILWKISHIFKLPITAFVGKVWALASSGSAQVYYHLIEEVCTHAMMAEQIL